VGACPLLCSGISSQPSAAAGQPECSSCCGYWRGAEREEQHRQQLQQPPKSFGNKGLVPPSFGKWNQDPNKATCPSGQKCADADYENRLLAYCHQVKPFIKNKGISCTNKSVPTKDIASTVVDYANKIEADLIMIMNKPDLGMVEYLTGTDAQKIVDISNIPVMTIQPMHRENMLSFGTGF
jgi:hypothetical protein